MRLITPSSLIERLKVNGSVARDVIKKLEKDGKIRRVVHHHSQLIYSALSKCPLPSSSGLTNFSLLLEIARNTTKGASD